MKFKKLLFLLTCLFVFSSLIAAQEIGNFVGTVLDDQGNPLPGATVTAKNTLTGLTQSTITNAQGRYRLERLT
ncbi:MAG: Carboxypeptidase regulatory-like domain, partial [Candidatus Aminicenantes bacterium]|nr:Carboxypeptidase regulatory-like domain [Candidatus Aminicenantes bacterium]